MNAITKERSRVSRGAQLLYVTFVCNILIVDRFAVIGEQDRGRQGCGPC